jgi:prepilin-type N-terminal cleavage/methylation domain-containing protein
MSRLKRRGFTIVELMMVIVIIGLLAALLANAVQSSRETARKTVCLNKMKQVGEAAIQFESRNNGYPGWVHPVFIGVAPNQTRIRNSWIYQLLPALGRPDLADKTLPLAQVIGIPLNEELVCPSDWEKMDRRSSCPTSIVCNAGRKDEPPRLPMDPPADWRSNAVFVNRDDRSSNGGLIKVEVTDASFMTPPRGDGLGSTLLLSENIDATTWFNVATSPQEWVNTQEWVNSMLFWPPVSGAFPPQDVHRINGPNLSGTPSDDTARPSSYHPHGVNMFFCGGHGRFVRADMDYGVYCALMTPRGRSAMEPGSNPPTLTPHPEITQWPPIDADDLN